MSDTHESPTDEREGNGIRELLVWAIIAFLVIIVPWTSGEYMESNLYGWFVFVTVTLTLGATGLHKVPAEPPHIGAVTVFGKRTGAIRREGWRFLPLYPLGYNVILIEMTKVDHDMEPAIARTPDMTELRVDISYTFTPDPDHPIEYLNAGGAEGVINIFDDAIDEAIREKIASSEEAPQTWIEAMKMSPEFLSRIVARILGISDDEEHKAELRDIAKKLKRGNGGNALPTLGIRLNRVNVTRIGPNDPKVAEASQKRAIEEEERKAETLELTHVRMRAEELKDSGLTAEQAYELIQTERGKITKTVEKKEWGLSPATLDQVYKTIIGVFGEKVSIRKEMD